MDDFDVKYIKGDRISDFYRDVSLSQVLMMYTIACNAPQSKSAWNICSHYDCSEKVYYLNIFKE